MKKLIVLFASVLIIFSSCKKDDPIETTDEPIILNNLPEFYLPGPEDVYAKDNPELKLIATTNQRLNLPQDLGFHPLRNELWIINRDQIHSGGSVVILFEPGTTSQTHELRRDGNSWHFMSLPTSMAFGNRGDWATGTGAQDNNHAGGSYAGPTLWSGSLDTFARNFGPGTNGSHLDMLHGSPFSMGIAHIHDNAYWVFDGYHGYLCFYDFVEDHGPGMHDHSDGRIHRHVDVPLVKHDYIPSHMILDKVTGYLYISETQNSRILRVNTKSGTKSRDLQWINEPLAEHFEITGTEWEVFFEDNLVSPSGIELVDNRLFVTDYANGDIIAINTENGEELGRFKTGLKGNMGITAGPDKKLYFVNKDDNQLLRIEPR